MFALRAIKDRGAYEPPHWYVDLKLIPIKCLLSCCPDACAPSSTVLIGT